MLRRLALALILAALLPAAARADSRDGETYCNPVDLDYRYNFEQLNEGISYRSGADPVIQYHKGAYYLFVTISGGWWRSTDLRHWEYVTPDKWPTEDMCAPAALSTGEDLYLFQSTFEQRPIFKIVDPDKGKLEFFNRWMPRLKGAEGPWDPALFHDPDTGGWYLYWGSSNTFPLYGIRLDPARRLAYAGEPVPLMVLEPEKHGWERFGQDHTDPRKPFMEGAWMTKHGGRYYLQYGAPGTEYNVYANGVYVGDHPLGPFTYAPYNPLSYRPGGFAKGAGHGNTFQDAYGNHWNTGTCWIGVNWGMERRIVMYPAGFTPDGQMWSNTRFGDFPQYLPRGPRKDRDESFTGWMLLSYRKPVAASSSHPEFPASNAADEDLRTFWVAGRNRAGETLTVDLQGLRTVQAVQVNYGDSKSDLFATDERVYTTFRLLGSRDGTKWDVLADLSDERRDRPCAYVQLTKPAQVRYVRYEHGHVASPNLAVADLRVFGNGAGPAPATPEGLTARRDADARNAFLSWSPVPGAVGYNVRWGNAPDRLFQNWQVFSDRGTELEIRALTVDQPYWFALEAFDENGVSKLSGTVGPIAPGGPLPASPGKPTGKADPAAGSRG